MWEAIVFLVCTASAVLKRTLQGKQTADAEWTEPATESAWSGHKWSKVKRKLMGSFCGTSAGRLEEEPQPQPQPQPLLLVGKDKSPNAAAPVWQRPILMGEKCELPRFSGLILYDERGQLLHDAQQDKPSSLIRTTLGDLLM